MWPLQEDHNPPRIEGDPMMEIDVLWITLKRERPQVKNLNSSPRHHRRAWTLRGRPARSACRNGSGVMDANTAASTRRPSRSYTRGMNHASQNTRHKRLDCVFGYCALCLLLFGFPLSLLKFKSSYLISIMSN